LTHTLEIPVLANPRPWQNSEPEDTNADGQVVPLDALPLVNLLNNPALLLDPQGRLPAVRPASGPNSYYYDVNGDGFCTPNDVLRIVNLLNRRAGEGELPVLLAGAITDQWEKEGSPAAVREIPYLEAFRTSPDPVTNLAGERLAFPSRAEAVETARWEELEEVLDAIAAGVLAQS
jgi:hypothetical protein